MDNSHGGHRQRMRERILSNGAETLQPHEIVEFMLYYAIPRRNLNPLAHALLDYFGTLQRLFSASPEALMRVDGVSASTADLLHRMGQAVLEYARPNAHPVQLKTRQEMRNFLIDFYSKSGAEGCWLLCLNTTGHLTHMLPLENSPKWFSPQNMRKAMSQALSCRAFALILAQKCDANTIPEEDSAHVRQLIEAFDNIDIKLLEYIVLSPGNNSVYYATNPLVEQQRENLAESPLLAHWLDET